MSVRSNLVLFTIVVALLAVGCQGPAQRLNSPPQGASDRPSPLQADMNYMVDNAMLYDMSVGEVHFVPHTSQVNSLGTRRLNRYAELLQGIGGTVHYDGGASDDPLTESRVTTIKEYLATAGLDMKSVTVEAGLSRGRGARASDAIRGTEKKSASSKQPKLEAVLPMP